MDRVARITKEGVLMIDSSDPAESGASIEQLVRKGWPSHCSFVGDTVVTRLVSAPAGQGYARGKFVAVSDHGLKFDLELAVKTLATAVAFVRVCLDVRAILNQKRQVPPTAEELRTALEAQLAKTPQVAAILNTEQGAIVLQALSQQ